MLKPYLHQFNLFPEAKSSVLGAILLVDADGSLRQSRTLLLSTLNIPVQEVAEYTDVYGLLESSPFSLVVINLVPSQNEAAKVAAYVRRHWSSAKILLLGKLSARFDDPLYDDIIDPSFNPSVFLDASKRLLQALGENASVQRES